MSESRPGEEWAAVMADVATALLGEPVRRGSREWRYGSKGSLAIDTRAGTWFDFEAGEGGGVVALVARERACSLRDAGEWLEAAGFVDARPHGSRRNGAVRPVAPPSTPRPSTEPAPKPDARAVLARRLWAAAVSADASAGHAYLAGRFAWPPPGRGFPALPESVRWMDRADCPPRDEAARWYGLPAGAAGVLVFGWRLPGDAGDEPPRAVSMAAVSEAGERVLWWAGQKLVEAGGRSGMVFAARAPDRADVALLCEGEVDGLALGIQSAREPRTGVFAAGGTGNLEPAARALSAAGIPALEVHADGDRAGRDAALKAVRAAGGAAGVCWYGRESDPAADLAAWLGERAAIREFDGGQSRADAECGAWHDLLRTEGKNDGP